MKRVLITSNCPSPYFVAFANELGKKCQLTVVFEMPHASNRDKSWKEYKNTNFDCVILNGIKLTEATALSFKITKYIKAFRDDTIIIANPTTPSGVIALLYLRRHKIPFILLSEGGFQGSGKGLKERFKKYLMEKADMFITGMGGDDDYFLKYGATKDKLKPYHFTSSYANDIDNDVVSPNEKQLIKKELGIPSMKMILYVGQFIHRKGVDILLNAFKGLDNDACLYLIGGSLTKEYKNIINNYGIKNVFCVDFIHKNKLRQYYQAADLFVMTTREDTWGLVINEAMEHGLPVITTNRCVAGNYLIENGVNGYIIETDNAIEANIKMAELLNNNELRMTMSKNNLNKIKTHTLEAMAKTIFDYIK